MQEEMFVVKCILAIFVRDLVLDRVVVKGLPAFAHVVRILCVMEGLFLFLAHITVLCVHIRVIVI
jgi:hypothetical protein